MTKTGDCDLHGTQPQTFVCRSIVLVVFLLTVGSTAQAQWFENDVEVPDEPWRQSSGEFGAMLVLSDKPEEFLEAWDQPTEGVPIIATDSVERGVPIVAFVLFIGCTPDDQGLCNASIDFEILRPDGSVYGAFKDRELWKNKPAPRDRTLGLAVDYVGVVIEPEDPLGLYVASATVQDHNADVALDLERTFEALGAGGNKAPSLAADPGTIQGGFSTDPLRSPVFDSAEVAVETAALNKWLDANYEELSPETMKGTREQLFYIITSRVAEIHARDGVVFPAEDDSILETQYFWSERLGVFGGHLIYNALKRESSPKMKSLIAPPKSIKLRLAGDMIEVESPRGHWSVRVPYYFMIWNMADFRAKNGVQTQLLTLSTSAARHEGLPGHSQATIMFIFAPGTDLAGFDDFWYGLFQITSEDDTLQLPVKSLTSRRRFDQSLNMHTEFVSWQTERGPIGVAYTGLNGTFQSNRPHFIDFLRSVSVD